MGKASFKKKDKNRYRKVYPYIRKAPVWEYCSDVPVEIEVGEIVFINTDTGTYTFTSTFPSTPMITAISYDSENNSQANVNIYVDSVDRNTVVIKSSATFTGKVHFHAIMVECP
tara:strand:+ start:1338 stop:1679 length:342 start_codon:yes stop_codon:yes gene_type:complete